MFRILLKKDGTQVLQQAYTGLERIEGKSFATTMWKDVPMFTEREAEDKKQKFIEKVRRNIKERETPPSLGADYGDEDFDGMLEPF